MEGAGLDVTPGTSMSTIAFSIITDEVQTSKRTILFPKMTSLVWDDDFMVGINTIDGSSGSSTNENHLVVTQDGIFDASKWRRREPNCHTSVNNLLWSPAIIVPKSLLMPENIWQRSENSKGMLKYMVESPMDNTINVCIPSILLRLRDSTERWIMNAVMTSLVINMATSVFSDSFVDALNSTSEDVSKGCASAINQYRALKSHGMKKNPLFKPYNLVANDIVFVARFATVYSELVDFHSERMNNTMTLLPSSSRFSPRASTSSYRYHVDTYEDVRQNIVQIGLLTKYIDVWAKIFEYCCEKTREREDCDGNVVPNTISLQLPKAIISHAVLTVETITELVSSSCVGMSCHDDVCSILSKLV